MLAVKAARAAFETFSQTSREERVALLERIIKVYKARMQDVAVAISDEMGAPMKLALQCAGRQRARSFRDDARPCCKDFEFEETIGTTQIRREPVGVCGLITPWNWPINQISCKVAPALAAGCTIVLKPSEVAPLSAHVFAEILAEAGVPKGVFNMVDGDGPTVGEAISRHPDIDMVSFTGSTRAGVQVAKAAADTVKRVSQELGGKSANIILEDADLNAAVKTGVLSMMSNTGQSCNAPSRMLVPAKLYDEAVKIAKAVAEKPVVGDPKADGVTMGPVVEQARSSRRSSDCCRRASRKARRVVDRRARVGRTAWTRATSCKPTVFANVNNDDDDRARGNLRAGAGHDSVPGRRGSDPHRQRHGLRTVGLRVFGQHRACATRRAASAHGHGPPQRRSRRMSMRRSAATSSRATAASGAARA